VKTWGDDRNFGEGIMASGFREKNGGQNNGWDTKSRRNGREGPRKSRGEKHKLRKSKTRGEVKKKKGGGHWRPNLRDFYGDGLAETVKKGTRGKKNVVKRPPPGEVAAWGEKVLLRQTRFGGDLNESKSRTGRKKKYALTERESKPAREPDGGMVWKDLKRGIQRAKLP